jgi:hypothetical protein
MNTLKAFLQKHVLLSLVTLASRNSFRNRSIQLINHVYVTIDSGKELVITE